MIALIEIADMLSGLLNFSDVYAGNTDTSNIKKIGVYLRENQISRKCIGNTESYQTAKIRILIHWTDNPSETESYTYKMMEIIENISDYQTAEHIIKFTEVKAVRSIGKDEKGISEFIIDTDLIYERI